MWRDSPKQPLEQRLESIMTGALEFVARVRQKEGERRREEEARAATELRRQEEARQPSEGSMHSATSKNARRPIGRIKDIRGHSR
jgi:hypothetical protein